ncbi:MAG: 50S ribosomal protein L15 [Candidatus Omnitrophota bacterium]
MLMNNLVRPHGAVKKRKIVGRGSGSGHGKTSCRGVKGQNSRSGRHFYTGFEGGQSPLIRRIPKRGFRSKASKKYEIINLEDLKKIKKSEIITPLELEQVGLIKNQNLKVKILGNGQLKKALTIKAHYFSGPALRKITEAGGKPEIIK